MDLEVPTLTSPVSSNTLVFCCSGRVVIQPCRFMYWEESLEVIIEEHETDPTGYD